MKTPQVMLIIALSGTSLFAQPREGRNKELSLSGGYQNISSGGSSGSSGAFLISPRLGFFVVEGLELEPELTLMVGSGSGAVYMLNGNVTYNFVSTGRGVPFILIGYGIANTIPFFNVPTIQLDTKVDVLNLGAGVKVFVKEDVALRVEYRHQRFSGEGETFSYGSYSFTQKVDARIHTVQFGFSILL